MQKTLTGEIMQTKHFKKNHQFSSLQSLDRWGRPGDMKDGSAKILFQSFLQEAIVSSSGIGKEVRFFYVVHPAFPLPATASPILQCALKNVFF